MEFLIKMSDNINKQESFHSCNVEFSHFQNMELSFIILTAIFTNYVEMKYVLVSIDIDVAMEPKSTVNLKVNATPPQFGYRSLVASEDKASGRR